MKGTIGLPKRAVDASLPVLLLLRVLVTGAGSGGLAIGRRRSRR